MSTQAFVATTVESRVATSAPRPAGERPSTAGSPAIAGDLVAVQHRRASLRQAR